MNDVLKDIIYDFKRVLDRYGINYEIKKLKCGDVYFYVRFGSIYGIKAYITMIFCEESLGLEYQHLNTIIYRHTFSNIAEVCKRRNLPTKAVIKKFAEFFVYSLGDEYDVKIDDELIDIKTLVYRDTDAVFGGKTPTGLYLFDYMTNCKSEIEYALAAMFGDN